MANTQRTDHFDETPPRMLRRGYRIDQPHAAFESPRSGGDQGVVSGDSADSLEPVAWSVRDGAEHGLEWSVPRALVTVRLGQLELARHDFEGADFGTLWSCPDSLGEQVEVQVNGVTIARGIPMVWQNRLCVRITERLG